MIHLNDLPDYCNFITRIRGLLEVEQQKKKFAQIQITTNDIENAKTELEDTDNDTEEYAWDNQHIEDDYQHAINILQKIREVKNITEAIQTLKHLKILNSLIQEREAYQLNKPIIQQTINTLIKPYLSEMKKIIETAKQINE